MPLYIAALPIQIVCRDAAFSGRDTKLLSHVLLVLVWLGHNQPNSNSFLIKWAKKYLTRNEPDGDSELQLTVRGIFSVSEVNGDTRFIVCGQIYRCQQCPRIESGIPPSQQYGQKYGTPTPSLCVAAATRAVVRDKYGVLC